jgi:transposase
MNTRYAGLDWASQLHAVCIVDDRGRVVKSWTVEHSKQGLADMCQTLRQAGVSTVAIERPSGLVVQTLLESGLQVVPIHPNVVKATRPRYSTNGSKSDASDAYLLADLLRTDGHRFEPLREQEPAILALRTLVRGRNLLMKSRIQLTNQLRSLLESFWPGPTKMFCAIDTQISLAFIERYPTPAAAKGLGLARISAFCAKHHYSGRSTPQELLQHLREAPCVAISKEETSALSELVRAQVAVLQPLLEQEHRLTRQIEKDITELGDGQLLMSLPRCGRLGSAQILAELGSVRERFTCPERLAAEAGASPFTRQSGKYKGTFFRSACNRRLRVAVTRFADASRHASTWAADVYTKARARGHDHKHAIRVLARAWINVIWRMWMDHKRYDPSLHGAAVRLIQEGG